MYSPGLGEAPEAPPARIGRTPHSFGVSVNRVPRPTLLVTAAVLAASDFGSYYLPVTPQNRRRARALASVSTLTAIVFALGGCSLIFGQSYSDEYVEKRKANLVNAVEEFESEPEPLPEILCEYDGGKVALNRGFTHDYVFSGADSFGALYDRLIRLGYGVTGSGGSGGVMSATRSDGIGVSASVMTAGELTARAEESLEEHGCEVPPEGAVAFQLREG